MSFEASTNANVHTFDARGVARRFRHSAIFGAIGVLRSGETMRFVNDHDPLPLIAQLRERLGDNLTVTYRQSNPDITVIDFGITGLPIE
ncbi:MULTISPECIES: DUF2249 domain-containing protein [unclassified Rhodanobacter]|uniref:DUF2249 domain-containing protein n=1 Tax=unclassified Rhodanobacter TaxID=2621553 RepID=UPI000987B254|nr:MULTISPECIES: DUF2249 domain-containing protein [unclassified Rhodanobacter]OOG38546.1 hypothetical protein B0E51_13400 [Rhodanobacter sp. C05]OOG50115.1 hypothetical protein B0E50_02980 [Rhodanobacter sp. C01]OOG52301.1 hypothetical protein B0E48_17170 [Rhodanobacter sp. C03]OOG65966.1 hypothetical protein B0E46_00160 [Rhodanobacter sp. B04]